MARVLLVLLATTALAASARAQGGPPMLTDDPGTPGAGHVELNVSVASEFAPGASAFEAPLVDLNLGVGDRVQLKVEGALEETPDAPSHVGLGDVGVGVKWRFLDSVAGVPLAVSTYPQVGLRSFGGEPQTGGRPVDLFLPVEVQHAFGPVGVNAELGYAVSRDDPSVIAGLAIGADLTDRTNVAAELHETALRTTGEHERYANVGLRQAVEAASLLLSVGHSLPSGGNPAREWIAFVGVQLTR